MFRKKSPWSCFILQSSILRLLLMTILGITGAWKVNLLPASKLPNSTNTGFITFGVTLSMTGDASYRSLCPGILNSLEMWLWWVNSIKGGINFLGRKYYFKLKWMDNGGNQTAVTEMTKYLIEKEAVDFMFGPYSSTLSAVASAVTESKSFIMMASAATTTSVFSGTRFMFSPLSPATAFMSSAVKTLVLRGARNIVNIAQGQIFAISAGNSVQDVVQGMQLYTKGLKIIHHAILSAFPTNEEINSLVCNLTSLIEHTDLVVGSGYFNVCAMLLKAFKAQGYDPSAMLFSVCVDDPGFLPTFGMDDSRYILGAVQWNEQMPLKDEVTGWTAKQFADLYRSRYFNMSPHYVPAAYFAGGLAFVQALKSSPALDSMNMAYALSRLSMNTFYGHIQFDGNGQSTQDYSYIQYNDKSQLQIVIPDEVATGPLIYPMPSFSYRKCVSTFGSSSCKCFPEGCPKCTMSSYLFNVTECALNRNLRTITFFQSAECEGGVPLPESVDMECGYVPLASPIAITVQIVACLGGFFGLCILVWIVWHRRNHFLKASQPFFCMLMCVGGIICAMSPLSLLGLISTATCQARPWLFHIPFTLMVGSLFVKTFRVWRIFGNEKLVKIKYTVKDSLNLLVVLMSLPTITLTIWFILRSPMKTTSFVHVPNIGDISEATCSTFQIFVNVLVFFEVVLVVVCCYFSFQNRKVSENFSETQYILVAVYSVAFIFGFTNIVALQNVGLSLRVLMRGLGTSLSCIIALGAVFLPKILILHFHILGDPANQTTTSQATRTQDQKKHLMFERANKNQNEPHVIVVQPNTRSRCSPTLDDTKQHNLVNHLHNLITLLNSKLPERDRVQIEDFIARESSEEAEIK